MEAKVLRKGASVGPEDGGAKARPEVRKMCVVVPHILARGPAARPRCIPPAYGALGLEPRAPFNRIAV